VNEKDLGIEPESFSDPMRLMKELLKGDDTVARVCTLYVIEERGISGFWNDVRDLEGSPERQIHVAARQARAAIEGRSSEKDMLSPGSRMIHLQHASIFFDLTVGELATVASLTDLETHGQGEIIVKEGGGRNNFFVVVSGDVSVIRKSGQNGESTVIRMGKGECFGEMALLEDRPRSATIRAETECRFLVLDQKAFYRLMRDFPQIPINMCRLLSRRIRELQEKFLPRIQEEQAHPN